MNTSYIWSHLILRATINSRFYCCSHFIEKDIEAQSGQTPCLRLHSLQVEEPDFIHLLFSKPLVSVHCEPGSAPDTGGLERQILSVSLRSPQPGFSHHLVPRHSFWTSTAITACPTHGALRPLSVTLMFYPVSSLRLGFCLGISESWNLSLALPIPRAQKRSSMKWQSVLQPLSVVYSIN